MTSLFEQCDFHIHSHLSGCAREEMRITDVLRACADRGLRHVGITDHIFPSTDPDILHATRKELGRIDCGMNVYLGCEADVFAVGGHTVSVGVAAAVDYVMVSSNHYQLPWVSRPAGRSAEEIAGHFLEMFEYACSLDLVDVIAHPLCEVSGQFGQDCLNTLSDAQILGALDLARTNRIAMEISPRALSRMHPVFRRRFYGLCREVGLKFAVGSDAHDLAAIGGTWALRGLVEELGVTDDEIWLPGDSAGQRVSGDNRSGRT